MGITLGIDIGTTAIKSVLIDETGILLATERLEQHQYFPGPGMAEQDPDELFELCLKSVELLLHKNSFEASDIQSIGIDHQGETCLIWNKETGKPEYPAITWQDRRMAVASERFAKVHGDAITSLTGLRSDSYYSAWKLRWLLDHIDNGQSRAEKGELLAGTLNTWIIWKLTDGESFITDEGSAGCMMLCNPRVTGWDTWLLRELNIPEIMLPQILPSNAYLGMTDKRIFFNARIPIWASLTDCAAGIIGSGAIHRGDLTVTYGTGSFVHMITGGAYHLPNGGLTSACCFNTIDNQFFQLNGICYSAGSAVKWLIQELELFKDTEELEALAKSVSNTNGVFFIPALNGWATPAWDQSANGAFLGITASCNKAHMARAVLESMALQVVYCCRLMEETSGIKPIKINAIGGMTSNSFLMQLQADLSGIPVQLPKQTEPAYGAACMALGGLGVGPCIKGLAELNPPKQTFFPSFTEAERNERFSTWVYALNRTLDWYPNGKQL